MWLKLLEFDTGRAIARVGPPQATDSKVQQDCCKMNILNEKVCFFAFNII
jgi:hypothetical protein